jgi:hypothetical protein
MKVPVPHDVTEDASSRHNAAWKIFYAHHLYTAAPLDACLNAYTFHVQHTYSVVQTYNSSPAWNQNPLLQEQKLSGLEKKSTVTVWQTSLSNPYSIYVEIKSTRKLGNACYDLEQNIFSSSSLYKNMKIKI